MPSEPQPQEKPFGTGKPDCSDCRRIQGISKGNPQPYRAVISLAVIVEAVKTRTGSFGERRIFYQGCRSPSHFHRKRVEKGFEGGTRLPAHGDGIHPSLRFSGGQALAHPRKHLARSIIYDKDRPVAHVACPQRLQAVPQNLPDFLLKAPVKAGSDTAAGIQYFGAGAVEYMLNELRRLDYSPGMSEFKPSEMRGSY